MKPLLMMRTRGISGPLFAKHANSSSTLSSSIGNAISVGKAPGIPVGPELVTNGDASNGTTGWTAYGLGAPGNFTVQDGHFVIDDTVAGASGFGQNIAFVDGEEYLIRADIGLNGAEKMSVLIGTAIGNSETASLSITTSQTVIIRAFADTNSLALSFDLETTVADTVFVDNISVREIL